MSYGKNKLECFYHIGKFNEHENLKTKILDAIETSEFKSPNFDICEVNISKTDWHISSDFSREWVSILGPSLFDHCSKIYSEFGFNWILFHQIWFQQYMKNSEHGWHVHGFNFTNVYYLELPKNAPKTLLIDPFTQKTIIELDVKEGDTVLFPSFVLHKTEKNISDQRKTIISWNLDVGYPDENYKEISNSFSFNNSK